MPKLNKTINFVQSSKSKIMEHTYSIKGMTCNGCKMNVEKTLSSVTDVSEVYADLNKSEVSVSSERHVPMEDLQRERNRAGLHYTLFRQEDNAGDSASQDPQTTDQSEAPSGSGIYYCPMQCEGDKIYYEPGDCPVCGMDLVPARPGDSAEQKNLKELVKKLKVAVLFTLPIFVIAMSEMLPDNPLYEVMSPLAWNWVQFGLSLPVVFYAARMFFERAWRSIVSKNLNMFTLIGIGAGVAFVFSVAALVLPGVFPDEFRSPSGEVYVYFEAVTVILTLVLLGQVMEARAHSQTSSAIRGLLDMAPAEAYRIEADGAENKISVHDIRKNDRLRVKPGDKVPVDGKIIEGISDVDESMISGEPIPVDKVVGDEVIAGTINGSGSFVMQADKVGTETLLSQIIEMVNTASRSRAPMQNLADRVSRYFVPIVILIALITFAVWWAWGPEPSLVYAFVNSIAVLIIACPCALGLATPMSVVVGVGKGAQNGILIKNAEALENLSKIDVLITDKTGTLTEGRPTLEKLVTRENEEEEHVLDLICSLNQLSEHPIAQAIVRYGLSKSAEIRPVENYRTIAGKGVSGSVGGRKILVGNESLMLLEGIPLGDIESEGVLAEQRKGKTVSYVAIEGEAVAYLVISDPIKSTTTQALKDLDSLGIELVMATGDNEYTAKSVASELGISDFHAGCTPESKLELIRSYQEQGKKVAMAGDGINDAPSLAQADVGIAMGTGTDVAIESAQITLVKGDLQGIVKAEKLSRAMLRNIKENLFFAFVYNSIGVPIAAGVLYPFFGILLSPMIAAAAMSFSSVSVIANSLRLRNVEI